jgi:hypothetical protein
MSTKNQQQPVEDEFDDGDDEGITEIEYLGALLQTDEGESITQVLDRISKHIENQNKLFVKLVIGLEKISANIQNGKNQSAGKESE